MLPKHVANAHQKGYPLSRFGLQSLYPMTNCCLIDLKVCWKMVLRLKCRGRSPKSIRLRQLISQIIANVASSQYGGCSADRIDEIWNLMQRRITKNTLRMRKNGLTWQTGRLCLEENAKDIYDAMQSLEYEINTLSLQMGKHLFSLGFWSRNQSFRLKFKRQF